jgi:hypothetical protein
MELQIVNPDPRYTPATLVEPRASGYIHIAAEVRPPRRPGPILFRGRTRALLARLDDLVRQVERVAGVSKVTLYEAVTIPPFGRFPYVKERAGEIRFPRFDVVVLIETTSPDLIRGVQASAPYRALVETLRANARRTHVLAARNVKRIGDVDRDRQGLFLFNYFVADDARLALQLWDHLAGWYEVETGLDNSTLLVPLDGESSDYLAINHARWDQSLPRFLSRQFLKKSFRTFVQANLAANRVGAMPVLYRLARPERRTSRGAALPVLVAAAAALSFVAFAAALRGRPRRRSRRSPTTWSRPAPADHGLRRPSPHPDAPGRSGASGRPRACAHLRAGGEMSPVCLAAESVLSGASILRPLGAPDGRPPELGRPDHLEARAMFRRGGGCSFASFASCTEVASHETRERQGMLHAGPMILDARRGRGSTAGLPGQRSKSLDRAETTPAFRETRWVPQHSTLAGIRRSDPRMHHEQSPRRDRHTGGPQAARGRRA